MGLNKSIIERKMGDIGAEEEEMVLTYFSAQKFVRSKKDYRQWKPIKKVMELKLAISRGLYSKVL
jgi:hypothetical protein